MKNTNRLFGAMHGIAAMRGIAIIALIAVIGFSFAACEESTDPEKGGTPNSTDGGVLTLSTWSSVNTLANSNSEVWYTFSVVSGTTYHVWVKDYWSNSVVVADGYGDVLVTARYGSKTGTIIFEESDAGANSTTTSSSTSHPADSYFTASQTGTVYLRVHPETGWLATYGKFRVAVTTSSSRPAGENDTGLPQGPTPTLQTNGTWVSGNLPNASSEVWHTFSVTSGTTYYVWVKEYWSNSVSAGEGYADVLLTARYGSQTGTIIFEESDAGANSTTTSSSSTHPADSHFTANQTGMVHLRIHPETGWLAQYGIFKVAVTTTATRPSGE